MDFEREVFLGIEADELMENILQGFDEWFGLAREINRLTNDMRNCIQVTVEQTKEILILMLMTKISNHFQSNILLLQKGYVHIFNEQMGGTTNNH